MLLLFLVSLLLQPGHDVICNRLTVSPMPSLRAEIRITYHTVKQDWLTKVFEYQNGSMSCRFVRFGR